MSRALPVVGDYRARLALQTDNYSSRIINEDELREALSKLPDDVLARVLPVRCRIKPPETIILGED